MANKYEHPGQPTTYKPEYCEMLVEHMKKGFSFESFAADIDSTRATLYNWEKAHPEFLDAKKRGHEKGLKTHESAGLAMEFGKSKGNPTSWIFTMKNRFGWKDTQVIEFEGDLEYTPPEHFSAAHASINKPKAD